MAQNDSHTTYGTEQVLNFFAEIPVTCGESLGQGERRYCSVNMIEIRLNTAIRYSCSEIFRDSLELEKVNKQADSS